MMTERKRRIRVVCAKTACMIVRPSKLSSNDTVTKNQVKFLLGYHLVLQRDGTGGQSQLQLSAHGRLMVLEVHTGG